MYINCDVTLRWDATPEQLRVLGAALWRWCTRTAGDTGIYQYLDNQALADLIAGRLPASSQTARQAERRGVHLRVRAEAPGGRRAMIHRLRRYLPTQAVEDLVVDGKSWNVIGCDAPPPAAALVYRAEPALIALIPPEVRFVKPSEAFSAAEPFLPERHHDRP